MFETRGRAPQRKTLSPFVALGGGATFDIYRGLYLALDIAAETHFMPLRPDSMGPGKRTAQFALRSALSLGQHF